ncbi:universal stress protein [Granulicella sp. L60]|uniref:universal stress protein n=1 Tax=Granulicella sp. L60 TaxID=1641866 RepID=UPI00131EC573|nr:universal stress protein [Granulicella sp. L60]
MVIDKEGSYQSDVKERNGSVYEKILIAYDGSTEAERALDEGVRLAQALGSHVTLATIAEPMPGYYGLAVVVAPEAPDQFRQDQLQRLGSLQVKASELAKAHGVTIETTLIEADEVTGILEAATALKANLIVVGLRRHDQHLEWVGTVRQIANRTPCPILAVV